MTGPPKEKKERGLTAKQEAFCQAYVACRNATQAAVEAGYSERTAGSIGQENLKKPEIQKRLAELQEARSARTRITQDWVLETLQEVVERCMQRAPVMVRKGKEMVQLQEDGADVWQFNARGATGALDLLGKHMGMWQKEKDTGPVTINITREVVGPAGEEF